MIKFWLKIIKDDKIIKSYTHTVYDFDPNKLSEYLAHMCLELDIATPIVLHTHANNFHLFNITQFVQNDFVEPIDFDKLLLENITE